MFAVFFTFFIIIYGLINTYIFSRFLHVLPQNHAKPWLIALFWFLALSYIAARTLEKFAPSAISDILVWIGSLWLAAMTYALLIVLAVDLARLANHFLPFFPDVITRDIARAKLVTGTAASAFIFCLLVIGRVNAANPRVKTLDLAIQKKSPVKELTIALASDIHLGTIISNGQLTRVVDKINAMKPDIVLLAGDVVDEDIAPVIRQNLGETLTALTSRYGTYAVTGNHEFIGGADEACRYLEAHGIIMLRDRAVTIDHAFTIVGREDRSALRFGGGRKGLSALLSGVDLSLPVIMMDHQPSDLDDAVRNGVDLQLSGHTHH
jgi:predicted MPP superfamily phosphohydrolase